MLPTKYYKSDESLLKVTVGGADTNRNCVFQIPISTFYQIIKQ